MTDPYVDPGYQRESAATPATRRWPPSSGGPTSKPRMRNALVYITTVISALLLFLIFTSAGDAASIFSSPLPTISPISPLPTVSPLPEPPTFTSPLRIHVDDTAAGDGDGSSWADAFTDLQDALDLARIRRRNRAVEIWVAEGLYVPSVQTIVGDPRSATFRMLDDVEIYGGFQGDETERAERDWEAHPTVLGGDLDGDDTTGAHGILNDPSGIVGSNAYHVVRGSDVGETAVLDGFFITGGQADGDRLKASGGGLEVRNGTPSLRRLVCQGNLARYGGGAILDHSGEAALVDVRFINNTATWTGGGVYIFYGSPIFKSSLFVGNSAGSTGGGVYASRSEPTFVSSLFVGNSADYGAGVSGGYSVRLNLINTTLTGNTAGVQGGAVQCSSTSSLSATNTVMWDNTAPAGAQIYTTTGENSISYSLIQGSGGSGTGWDASLGTDGGGNIDTDPAFVDPDHGDYRLDPLSSPAVDAGDDSALPPGVTTDLDHHPRVVGAAVDIGAYEFPPLFVDDTASGASDGSSWADAFTDLQDALDLAAGYGGAVPVEIWVAQGRYIPSAEADAGDGRSVTFQLLDGVAIYGGFHGDEAQRSQRDWEAYPTVLSGDIHGDDVTQPTGILTDARGIRGSNAYHVVTASFVTRTAALDGVFVTGGQADGGHPHSYGGGVHILSGSPSLSHVTIQGNSAHYGGGARLYYGDGATLMNVRFIGNTAGYGGGIYNYRSGAVVANALFQDNASSYGGGALRTYDSDMAIVNATFAGNSAPDYGSAVFNTYGSLSMSNSVISEPDQIDNFGTFTISHSLIPGSGGSGAGWDTNLGVDGGGNIDADPLFVDPAAHDYRLRLDSPAVDAGDNAAFPPSLIIDLAGNPRFVDVETVPDTGSGAPPLVDMGAYEAMLTLYVPPDATGPAGSEDGLYVILPILVGGDTTDLGIYSFQFSLAMDLDVLAPVAYLQEGTMSEGWNVVTSQHQPGQVFIGGYGTTPLSGANDVLIYLICEVTGILGDETELDLDGLPFNEGQPPATMVAGHFTIDRIALSGDVVYALNDQPVAGAQVALSGPASDVETTDAAGGYAFTLHTPGAYTTTVTKSGDVEGAVSALDAAWIADYVAGNRSLDLDRRRVADVNESGLITTYDAAIVLQYSVGLSNIPSRTGEWDFSPSRRAYPTLHWSLTQERFDAYLFGDVTGNWGGGPEATAAFSFRMIPSVTLPQLEAEPGDEIIVPVEFNGASRFDTLAFDMALTYDSTVLRYRSAALENTLLAGGTMAVNDTVSDELVVGAYSLDPVVRKETLIYLTFDVVGEVGDHTEIAFSQLQINEGQPQVQSVAGGLDVVDLTPPEIDTTSPPDGDTGVSVDVPIAITFTEPISVATFDAALSGYAGPLTATWSADQSGVTLTHDVLASETTYTVTLAAADDLAGNSLVGAPVTWTFTTRDAVPPQAQLVAPPDNATGVELEAPIVITFTEPISVATFGASLAGYAGPVTATWSAELSGVTLTHDVLASETTYTVTLAAADDLAGNSLVGAPATWSFTTIDAAPPQVQGISPSGNAVGVELMAPIVVTFTDSIDPSTLGFTLTPSCDIVTVTWNAISTVVTLEHTTPFTMQGVYTAAVAGTDDAGNEMVVPYRWTFFTWEGHRVFLPIVKAD